MGSVVIDLANRITIARIFLVPVVIFLLLVRFHFLTVTINHPTNWQ